MEKSLTVIFMFKNFDNYCGNFMVLVYNFFSLSEIVQILL